MDPHVADRLMAREKLLIRIWLPAVGCRHFRSPRMSDAEAHTVIAALEDKKLVVHRESPKAEHDLPCAGGRVYCQTRLERDPNCPERSVVVARCLLHTGKLAPGVLDQVCTVPLPESEAAARSQAWEPIGKESSPASAVVVDQAATPRGFRWVGVAALLAVTGILITAAAAWRLGLPPFSSAARPATKPATPRSSPTSPESAWLEARREIRDVLNQDWAKRQSKQSNPDNLSDVELLIYFIKLFRRPSLSDEVGFDHAQQDSYDRFVRADFRHPFLDFLQRLPEKLPPVEPGDEKLTWAEASEHLQRVIDRLPPGVIGADAGRPAGLIQEMVLALNYARFYSDWKRRHGPKTIETLWCEELDNDRARLWQPPVRMLLQEGYPRH